MKNTDLETVSEPPTQPARITRRSFVKRTSATAIVTVLALHAFRNEARAETAGGLSAAKILLKSVTPPPEQGDGCIHDFSIIPHTFSADDMVKASIGGQLTDYWKKVGEVRSSWSIKLTAIGTKEPLSGQGPIDKAIQLNPAFTVSESGGSLYFNDESGTDHKEDPDLALGFNGTASLSASGKIMTVKVNVLAGWAPSGVVTGVGLVLTGPGGVGGGVTLNLSGPAAPHISVNIEFTFELQ